MTSSFDAYHEWLGIPPKDQPPNLYRLLGLDVFETNLAVIENAADRQMAHLRTFQSGRHSGESQRLLTELSKAKVVLLREEQKEAYDQSLRAQLASSNTVPSQAVPSNTVPSNTVPSNAVPSQALPVTLASPATLAPATPARPSGAKSLGGRSKPKPIWAHPAVLAGAIGGAFLAVIGLVLFLTAESDEGEVGPKPGNVAAKPAEQPVAPVAPEPHKEIPATFGSNDPVSFTALSLPEKEVMQDVRNAWGMTSKRFALCQIGSLDGLEDLSLRLSRSGYRLDHLRPYAHNGGLKFAAIWRRDGRPWRVALGRTPSELKAIDEALDKRGFKPVDVAGYADGTKYAAVWWIPGVGADETAMTVGLDREQTKDLAASQKAKGWLPNRVHYCFNQDGVRYESDIWRRGEASEDVVIHVGDESQFETKSKTQLPVSASQAYNPRTRRRQYSAVLDAAPKSPLAWEVILGSSPRDSMPKLRSRLGEDMLPHSLDVTRLGAGANAKLLSTSVWNLAPGAVPNPRQLVVISSHKGTEVGTPGAPATGVAGKAGLDDPLLFQGGGGVEVLDTAAITKLSGVFTAEMWVQLSRHETAETRNCLMGTARGEGPLETGWQLIAIQPPSGAARLEFLCGGVAQPILRPVSGDFLTWRHVAIGCRKGATNWDVTIYVEGQPVSTESIESSVSLRPSGNNLTLGVHPSGSCGEQLHGGIRQFRLSEKDRFDQTKFTPTKLFLTDATTLAMLNFKRGQSTRMDDLSENNRSGIRRSGVWLADGAELPGHPGGGVAAVKPPMEPVGAVTPKPGEDQRRAAPDKVAVEAAVADIREIYADEYKRATTPAARIALADKLRKQADDEADLVSHYGLLKEAANAAAAGNNLGMASAYVDAMEDKYQASLWDDRIALIGVALKSTRSRPEKITIAQAAFDTAERASGHDEFEVAVNLLEIAATEARRAGDTDLAKVANQRSRHVKQIRDEFRAADRARVKVAAGSAEPEDFLVLGRFHCFLRDEWEDGLPLLEKSADSTLSKIAVDDGKNPTVAAEQTELAGQWRAYGETQKDEAGKMAALRRAYFWYSKAVPQLSGLSRARVERSLNELSELTGGAVAIPGAGSLAFLDVKPGEVHRFEGHTRDIQAVAVSSSGRYTASASSDGTIRVWNTATGEQIHSLTTDGRRSSGGGVAITPDEKYVLAGSGSTVAVWDLQQGKPSFAIPAGSSVYDIAVSADGRKLLFAVSSSRANLGVFGLAKRKPLGLMQSPSYPQKVRISSDGSKAISADSSRNVILWNLVSFRQVASFSPPGGSITGLDFAPDGQSAAITSSDTIYVWNPNTQKQEAALKDSESRIGSVRAVRFTPDSKHVVAVDYYQGILVWDVASEKVVGRIGEPGRFGTSSRWNSLALLPDPRGAVVGDSNGVLALFRLPDF